MAYNDLNTSFISEATDVSYDSDTTFHIYNELNYSLQQQQQQLQMANTAPINIQSPTNNSKISATGVIYGFRTRHLSCIEENDSDSLHSSSVPKPAFEMIQDVDEKFKKLLADDPNSSFTSWADNGEDEVDHIVTIDESRMYDLEYLDELSVSQVAANKEQQDDEQDEHDDEQEQDQYGVNVSEALWQSTVSEPVHRLGFSRDFVPGVMPDLMTTSCYGALNTSFGSEISGPLSYMDQSTPTKQRAPSQSKQEPIYATPEKRRECNRSFDSSCPSQSSSVYGGSMTSSLDLKCMTASGYGGNSLGILRGTINVNTLEISGLSIDNTKAEWNTFSGCGIVSPAEDINDEMAVKCLTAAENGKCILIFDIKIKQVLN